jgi:hypothetical protein
MTSVRPNILWYCADQQRWDTIHALGNDHIRTDAIDALVSSGVAFNRAYTQSPICTPARATFLTGRYPASHHVYRNGNAYFPAHEKLVTKRLAEAGYDCALVGKLHLAAAKHYEVRTDDGYRMFHWSHHPTPDQAYGHDYENWLKHEKKVDPQELYANLNYFCGPGVATEYHQTTWCSEMAIRFIVAIALVHVQQGDRGRRAGGGERIAEKILGRVAREIGETRIAGRAPGREQVGKARVGQHPGSLTAGAACRRVGACRCDRVGAAVPVRIAPGRIRSRQIECRDRVGGRDGDWTADTNAVVVHGNDTVVERSRQRGHWTDVRRFIDFVEGSQRTPAEQRRFCGRKIDPVMCRVGGRREMDGVAGILADYCRPLDAAGHRTGRRTDRQALGPAPAARFSGYAIAIRPQICEPRMRKGRRLYVFDDVGKFSPGCRFVTPQDRVARGVRDGIPAKVYLTVGAFGKRIRRSRVRGTRPERVAAAGNRQGRNQRYSADRPSSGGHGR